MASRLFRYLGCLSVAAALVLAAGGASAQERGRERQRERRVSPPPRSAHAPYRPRARGQFVFVGGFFYDPYFGPYPWWAGGVYRHPYYPVYERRAIVRLQVTPRDAAVYVDGFYAGIVDDFDGVFQGLPLTPGGHTIEIYREGYRTERQSLYLSPNSTMKLHRPLEHLAPGELSEPPVMAPLPPAPPEGSYRGPVTVGPMPPPVPRPAPPPTGPVSLERTPTGTMQITVQPPTAVVQIDGMSWMSSDGVHFSIEVPAGTHRVDISAPGFKPFTRDIDVRPGETAPVNVSLSRQAGA